METLRDLSRPRRISRTTRNVALVCCAVTLIGWILTERKNATLTNTNQTLVRMLDEELSDAQAQINDLLQIQEDVRQALFTRGTTAVDSILRKAEDR